MEGSHIRKVAKSKGCMQKIIAFILMLIMVLTVLAVSATAQDELDGTEEDFVTAMWGIIIICMVIALLIAIALAVWIYKDAEKRGKSGVLWVVLLIVGGLVFNIIGVIAIIVIWLLVRPPEMPPGMPYPPPQPGYPPPQPYYPPPQQPYYPPPQQPPPY